MMTNPFEVRWLKGWMFEVILMDGSVQIEARGFGECWRTPMYPGESPQATADRLVITEELKRRSQQSAAQSPAIVQPHPLAA